MNQMRLDIQIGSSLFEDTGQKLNRDKNMFFKIKNKTRAR